jgi:hypothetical protein
MDSRVAVRRADAMGGAQLASAGLGNLAMGWARGRPLASHRRRAARLQLGSDRQHRSGHHFGARACAVGSSSTCFEFRAEIHPKVAGCDAHHSDDNADGPRQRPGGRRIDAGSPGCRARSNYQPADHLFCPREPEIVSGLSRPGAPSTRHRKTCPRPEQQR